MSVPVNHVVAGLRECFRPITVDCSSILVSTLLANEIQSQGCSKARLVTSGNRVVSNRQPDHIHTGNVAIALVRRALSTGVDLGSTER